MTRLPNKSRLRNTLKKLAAIPVAGGTVSGDPMAGQEALDFLAMLAGLKPVFLLGRGLDEPAWVGGVRDVAGALGLHVIEGPYWNAETGAGRLPDWFARHMRDAFATRTAWYVCRARATADEVRELCATATPTVAREARLLGYPECCVAAHYDRNLAYQEIWLDILRRKAAGDDAGMRRLLAAGAGLDPETDDDVRRLERAMAVTPAPFTSINMCAACADDADGPARRLSRRYAELARAVDKGLARELAVPTGRAPVLL